MKDFLNDLIKLIKYKNTKEKPILLIGNSPNILNNKIGNEIDEKYFILRFNAGCIKNLNYSDYVGKKTDINIYCSKYFKNKIYENIKSNENDDNIAIIPFGKNSVRRMMKLMKTNNLKCLVLKKKPNNEEINLSYDLNLDIENKTASSGLLMIYTLLKHYDNLYIHGFSNDHKHYYNKVKASNKNNHNYNFEKEVFNYLVSKNKLVYLIEP